MWTIKLTVLKYRINFYTSLKSNIEQNNYDFSSKRFHIWNPVLINIRKLGIACLTQLWFMYLFLYVYIIMSWKLDTKFKKFTTFLSEKERLPFKLLLWVREIICVEASLTYLIVIKLRTLIEIYIKTKLRFHQTFLLNVNCYLIKIVFVFFFFSESNYSLFYNFCHSWTIIFRLLVILYN